MQKTIKWVKWADPIAPMVQQHQLGEKIEEVDEFHEEFEEAEESFGVSPKSNIGPVLFVPQMGLIPLFESSIPSKIYNFWMGHTNFDIDLEEKNKIVRVPGVEGLNIHSRYRFRIAIGYNFDENIVKKNVESVVCDGKKMVNTPRIAKPSNNLSTIKKVLNGRYKYWAIIHKQDSSDYLYGESEEEVENKIQRYNEDYNKVTKSYADD